MCVCFMWCGAQYVVCVHVGVREYIMSVDVLCISPCVLSVRAASCSLVLVSSHRVFVQGALRSI